MAPGPRKDDRVRPEASRRESAAGESAGKTVPKPAHEKAGVTGNKAESSNVPSADRKSTVPVPSKSAASPVVDTGADSASGGAGVSRAEHSPGMGGLDRRTFSSVRNPRGLTAVFYLNSF